MTCKEAMEKWREAVKEMYEAGSELGLAVGLKKYESEEEHAELDKMFSICDRVISAYEREAYGDEEEED